MTDCLPGRDQAVEGSEADEVGLVERTDPGFAQPRLDMQRLATDH